MNALFLFDIDGTILFLKQYRSKAFFQKVFLEFFGVRIPVEQMPNFAGMTDLQILNDLCTISEISIDKVLPRIDEIWTALLHEFKTNIVAENVELMPNISNMLSYLASQNNIRLSLVTGNFRDNAFLKLRLFDFEKYFPCGAFGDDFADRNLLPELAIQRANSLFHADFSPADSVILGDSPSDILCAKHSGALAVAVATGHHSAEELSEYSPDLIFENFNNHIEVTEKIFRMLNNRAK